MNILYVAPDIPIPHTGNFIGGSTHVMKIAEGLAKKGNQVFVISRRESKSQSKFEEISENVFTIRVYRGLFFPIQGKPQSDRQEISKTWILIERTYFFMYRLLLILFTLFIIKKFKIDAIVDRGSSRGIGVFSGYFAGLPSTLELIDPDYSTLSLRFTRKIYAYTTKIVPSSFHNKVEIVNAGVDTDLFKPSNGNLIREKYGLQYKKLIVYVGSLSEWHGVKDLIDIATLLDNDAHFLLIGKNLKELEKKAMEKGVHSKITFTDFVSHNAVPEYISAADIAIAPFNPNRFCKMKEHGFYFSPVKIFEYMACGKPIIASNVEIVKQIIQENECGLLAEAGNIPFFAAQIKKLLNDEELKNKLGKNGEKKVKEKYTWDNVAEKIVDGLVE